MFASKLIIDASTLELLVLGSTGSLESSKLELVEAVYLRLF